VDLPELRVKAFLWRASAASRRPGRSGRSIDPGCSVLPEDHLDRSAVRVYKFGIEIINLWSHILLNQHE